MRPVIDIGDVGRCQHRKLPLPLRKLLFGEWDIEILGSRAVRHAEIVARLFAVRHIIDAEKRRANS
jgi:hypothetical protein